MDTSMPPPSLPPPGLAQTPEAVITPRQGSASAASVPSIAAGPSQSTPSEKSKDDEKKSGGGHPKEAVTIPIEELQLPKSIITRLAKGVLPPNTQIQANAILAMTKSATVFINHLANAANEVTSLQNKKTIMPADVFRALDDIEFGFMRERVEAEFSKFNETQTTKRSAYRKKVSAAKKAAKTPGEAGADTSMAGTDADTTMAGADTTVNSAADSTAAGGQHRSKKARTDGNDEKMDVDDDVEDASDPESVPDEEEDEDEEEEEAPEEEGDGQEENDEERDELEEREDRPDEDEALDDGNNSD
ncbi:DNA polymerase epsilon subunit D [Cytospora mali]|uniref:DNA polymerase epsilon subunit D n=1 Tax=Cytospora mali TaxID=578113 RepID=A0A194VQJ0_CYTMA|nr:DNA polymerase epsilon subunit D [Valsa mali]